MKIFLYFFIIVSATACSKSPHPVRIFENQGGTWNIYIYESRNQTNLLWNIGPFQKKTNVLKTRKFLQDSLIQFNRIMNPELPGTVQINPDSGVYSVFFKIGNTYFYSLKNKMIRFAVIQKIWLDQTIYRKHPYSFEDSFMFFHIPDIDRHIDTNRLSKKQLKILYPELVKYLNDQIYFVSLQEFMLRENHYFILNDVSSIFHQIVVFPETVQFLEYLTDKYGTGRVIEFASEPYSKERWKQYFDEPVNETEEKFYTLYSDEYHYQELQKDQSFFVPFTNLLKLYHQNTKPVLFQK